MSCCKSCWSLLQTVKAISGDVHLLSSGIVPGVRLESFLASSNFFFSRHTLEYVLKPVKTCTAQKIWHFFASSHSVSYNAIDCGLSSLTTNLYQASAIYQILNTLHSESGEVWPYTFFFHLGSTEYNMAFKISFTALCASNFWINISSETGKTPSLFSVAFIFWWIIGIKTFVIFASLKAVPMRSQSIITSIHVTSMRYHRWSMKT